jgi:NAD(P)-dependent dehydrogenase (short-subunit alcohol dehydrogenase family)
MNKVVFITGASRGIGAATVEKFIKEGWNVVGFYNENKTDDTDTVKYIQMDISKAESIKEAFKKAFAVWGRVDSLVNCAGLFGYKKLRDYDEALMDQVVSVNEKGTYLTTQLILEYMKAGSIVHVSSTAGQVGSTDVVYAGTKAAVAAFVKSAAKQIAPDIRINCVSPGPTDTHMLRKHDPERVEKLKEMILLKRLGKVEEIANAIYFLAGDEASFITGTTLDVNGGMVLR